MSDTVYFTPEDCDLETFRALIGQSLDAASVPLAADIAQNVPVYDMTVLCDHLTDPAARRALMAEWAQGLGQGAGLLVLRGAYADTAPIDAATAVYEDIIAQEKGKGGADHFAASGANDRIWNSLQKLCLAAPETFALYFGNLAIDAVCDAWLGPGYQMTAQVNLVRPGGKAQQAHRDYHLGFQTEEMAMRFPAHVHDLSAVMTLQGAVAHCDMPVESGPTKLLPFSQLFRPGYLAYRHADFAALFEERCIQLPLAKGDALFFNPALFHAAGENRSADIQRMANLLQVSSPFGRAMEAVDRDAMSRALYPALLALRETGRLNAAQTRAAIAACAEGYSFPTNLDSDPPGGGLAPETQAALVCRAIEAGTDAVSLAAELDALAARRIA
ncbi:phytanoyl-CoA dioxygenase family protein [Vannielia litorea]|uniref:phytanoyl-CoA dioxygenase family protein n=1 Tax=Vannielia litorea TaxID=1217970 RepID=UPI001BCF4018|nr:phytanoyl-CoA dioxygenase family protein [Vannielia litorea]MBS8225536.1 phytanoyl-CoA dioxygenase [Vannielia litorea]